jgi:TonB family protein
MSDAWKQWEGQLIDATFALRRFLRSTDHSAVFLTDRGQPSEKLAIKFIQLEAQLAELQLARWKAAGKLSHPNLLRLFESGRCRLGEFDLLYVVLEYAEENLSEFLPQRPLTPAETRDVLTPALQGLGFLHSESLVHGRIKPSNILAIDDQLKLSSDSLFSSSAQSAAIPANSLRPPSPYDAPEAATGTLSPASDIWSLGMTLVETLTQRLPAFDPSSRLDPAVPDTLPAIYLDIARHCLQRDPQKRWSVIEASARLNPGSAEPSPPGPSASRVSPAEATPPRIQPPKIEAPHQAVLDARPPARTQTVSVRSPAKRYDMVPPRLERPPLFPKLPKFNYFPLIVIAALAFAAILFGPRLLRHGKSTEQAASGSLEPQSAPPSKNVSPTPAKSAPRGSSKSQAAANSSAQSSPPPQRQSLAPATSVKKASEKQPAPPVADSASLSAAIRMPASKPASKSADASFSPGEVLNQVLPDISAKARATIRGTVRVGIKLYVDSGGNVVGSEVASQGPSQYFAEQALQAGKQWDFAPAKVDGHAVNSEWLVRFEFKPSGTHAVATQSAP